MISHLKKFLLIATVLILFVLYAFQEQPQSIAVDPKSVAYLQTPSSIVRPPSQTSTPALTPASLVPPDPTLIPSQTAQVTVRATEPMPDETAIATVTPPPPTATASAAPTQTETNPGGTFTGSEEDAHWGYVTVAATVSDGVLVDVQFLEYPNHRNRSVEINDYAVPELIQEAIQAQWADVDIVSGATDTSRAFIRSLESALQQAAS